MKQYGTASVYGVDGTVKYSGTAIAVIPDSVESEHSADVEEFMSGINQLLGFNKSNERMFVDLTLTPKSTTLALAKGGIAKPPIPSKVTLHTDFVDSAETGTKLPGDYIYTGGARRTVVKGQAALRLRIFKPLDSPLTVDQLVTEITA